MAKITLTMDGKILREMQISKDRITIGRGPHNDIVIDDLAISAEHAVIVTVLTDSYLEDLNSTNGTQINGQPLKKHFLQDKDVIELADYRLKYTADRPTAGNDATRPIVKPVPARATPVDQKPRNPSQVDLNNKIALIKVLNGANAGKESMLTKVLTTIGRPGLQVAVITRDAQGFSLTHVEGEHYPMVNGRSIGAGAHSLAHSDVIEMSGARMAFLLSPAK